MPLDENLKNRKWLLVRLRAEVVGPDPAGEPVLPLDPSGLPKMTWVDFRKPKRQINGEEVLWQDPPGKRYGAGILYPSGVPQAEDTGVPEDVIDPSDEAKAPEFDDKQLSENEKLLARESRQADDSEDYDVTLANAFHPSAIGLSFMADLDCEPDGFRVEMVCVGRLGNDEITEQVAATYRKANLKVGDLGGKETERAIWLRIPLRDAEGNFPHVNFTPGELIDPGVVCRRVPLPGVDGIQVVVVSRPWPGQTQGAGRRLLTISLINRKTAVAKDIDSRCFFQAGIRIRGRGNGNWILPYPERGMKGAGLVDMDPDEAINRLLYREHQTYAIGHGCAADWRGSPLQGTNEIWSDVLPAHETPSTTAELEVENPDGGKRKIRVSMRKLAGLAVSDNGRHELNELVDAYAAWIDSLEQNRPAAPPCRTHSSPLQIA